MFGKKNFTNTQIKGRIVNPDDDILINSDSNNLTLYSKYKVGSRNLSNKSVMEFRDSIDNIKLYQSASGLVDYNGKVLSTENKHLEDGLVVWYDKILNSSGGLITDKSGSNVNGTLTSIINTPDNTLYFDGTNDYITGSDSSIKSSGSNVSVSVWVKPTEYVSSTNGMFILGQVNTSADDSSNSNKDYKLEINPDNKIYFVIHSNGDNTELETDSVIKVNDWNHIVCTYDNSNINAYLNGGLVESIGATNTLSADWNFTVGRGSTNEDYFKGYMRDIRVYDRPIETSEIVELYNIGYVDIKDVINIETTELPTANVYLKLQEGISSSVINYGNDATKTGTLNNGAEYKYYQNKSCVYYDGTNDLVAFTHSTQDNFIGAVTISMWFNIESAQSTETVYLISKRHYYDFEVRYVYGTPNKFKFFFGGGTNSSTTSGTGYEEWELDYDNIKYNKWYHFSVTRNIGSGDKIIYFYVNGVKYSMSKVNSINATVTEEGTTANFTIARQKGTANYSNMYTNNLRIYNSELTETQIQKIYREELISSSTSILPINTSNILKTITKLRNPALNSTLDETLILNLTGQDSTTTTYVSDYSLNRYNGSVTEGTLTYSSSNAAAISATNTLVFNGSTYLSLDGTKNNGVELKELNYNELSYSSWVYLYDLTTSRALISTDLSFNSIYNIYVDTNGRINVLFNNGINDTVIFNQVLSVNTWYNIIITLNNGDIKCFIGTTSSEPVEVVKYDIQNNITTSNLITLYNYPYNDYFSPDEYLVAKYLFNGSSTTTLNDESDNSLDATMTSFTSGDLSQRGYTFDGTDQYITLPNNNAFYTTNFTVSILFKRSSISLDQDIISFNQGSSNGFSGYIIRIKNSSNDVQFIAEGHINGNRTIVTLSNAISNDTLTQLVLRVSSDSGAGEFTVSGFKNGTATTASSTNTVSAFNWTSTNRKSGTIGDNFDNTRSFLGTIYDVQFFNTALDNDVIDELYKRSLYNYYYNYYYRVTNTLQIGRSELLSVDPTSNIYLNGEMDDIKVYSKALTVSEITANWNSGAVNYFSSGNNDTDTIIKLDGEPGGYSKLNSVTTTVSSVDDGLSSTYTGVGDTTFNNLGPYGVAYYKLNEGSGTSITDSSVYGNGTITGSIWTNKNTPNNDNSLYFDGTDDYVSISNNATYPLNGPLTISCWVKPNSLNSVICSKDFRYEFDLRLGEASSNNVVLFCGGGGDYEAWKADTTGYITVGEWNHLVVTRSDASTSKEVYFYFNGHKKQTENTRPSYNVTASTNNIFTGIRDNGGAKSLPFNGYISQFRIYNRELSHSEILDLYNYTEGWSSMAKYGNFCYDLNTDRKLEITTGETNSVYAGELWINPAKTLQQIVLKSVYTTESTRLNGDIKMELVSADSNNSNLIACWNLFADDYTDGNVIDYTGNGSSLNIYNISSNDKSAGLNFNNTLLRFDGTDNAISGALTSGNYFYDQLSANEDNYTVTAWINNVNGSTNIILALNVASGTSANNRMIQLGISTSGNISFLLRSNAQTNLNYNSTNTINSNQWYHVAFVFDINASQHRTIYVNGVEWTSTDTSNVSNLKSFPTTLYTTIGSFSSEGTYLSYEGSITDLRVYKKALTQSEIQDVMLQNMKAELSIQLGGSVTSISNNNTLIKPNTWNHLAYNYNSTDNEMRLYMNGEEIARNLSLTNTTAVNSNIVLGDQSFEGKINNFTAYSRNLTAKEIKRIYLGLDRLKLHLDPNQQTNTTFTSNIIVLNKAKKPSNTFIHPYGSGLTLVRKDIGFNNILNFDGSTAYIELDPESDLWRCRSFTIAMWIKPDSSGSGTNQHIFSRYLGSSHQSYYISYNYTTKQLNVVFSSGGNDITSTISVLTDIYTHLTVVFENNMLNIYINGKLEQSVEIPFGLNIFIDSTLKTVIGDSSDLDKKYTGYITDFRYYDTSLSIDAIRAIYSGYDLNGTNSSITKPELEYLSTDLTTVRNKDFVQPAKSALVLHLNNYTTGSIITSSSENSITATATSMVSSTTEFDFDGSSSYLSVADNSDLNISGTTLSISMWINPDTLASSTYRLIMKGSTDDYGLYINSSDKVVFNLTSSVTATSTTTLTTGNWYHITALYNGTNMNLYINGTDDSATVSGSVPASIPNTGTTIYIGATTTPNNYYDGKIRDIRIYNSAISTDSIKLIYNAGLTTSGEFSIAANKKIENANRYAFISKYLLDNNGETTDVLGNIARDSLKAHYKFNGNEYSDVTENTGESDSGLVYSLTFNDLEAGNLTDGTTLTYYSQIGSTSVATAETGGGNIEVYDNYGVKHIRLNDNGDQNEYIKITNDTNIDLSGELTLSMWFKLDPDVSDSNHNNIIISKGYQNEFDIRYDAFSDPPDLVLYNGNGSGFGTFRVTLSGYLTKGQWYHLVATRSSGATKTGIFYIDGSSVGSDTSTQVVTTSTSDTFIGARNTGGSNGSEFSAEFKNIKIYNKVLTPTEVSTLYATDLLDFNGRQLLDTSSSSIPGKMTTLRPNYLNSTKLIEYSNVNIDITSFNLISSGAGTINSNAVLFTGNTTTEVSISNGSNLMIDEWTLSSWYKLTNPSAKNIFLSRKETSKNFDIFIDSSDNEIKYKYNTTTVSSNLAIDITDYDWHHIAITKGQEGLESNIITFYHDGELINQRNEDLAFTTSGTDLIIGTDNTSGFNGYLDEFRLYSTKLNSVEIGKLSRNETLGGPIHYWLMEDDTTGSTIVDAGSAGNNLRLQGSGTTWDTTTSNVYYGSRSINFDGSSTSNASSAATCVLGAEPRCLGMWFKRSVSTDGVSEQELFTYGNSATSGEQFSVVINTASNIQVNIGSTSNIRATTRLNDTNWHHLSVLQLPNEYYSDDRAIKVFIDGNECTDTTTYTQTEINTRITGQGDLLRIGKGFNGCINEVKMYNYSLSQPEMDILYANKNHYMVNLS